MPNDVTLKIRLQIDGKDQVVEATTSTHELQKALDGARQESNNLRKDADKLSGFSKLLNEIKDDLSKTTDALSTFAAVNDNLIEAQTSLASSVNGMKEATDSSVDSIMALCQMGQEFGLISDDIGAQLESGLTGVKSSIDDFFTKVLGVVGAFQSASNTISSFYSSINGMRGSLQQFCGTLNALRTGTVTYSAGATGAAASTRVLSIALKGLMISTGIGVAFVALTGIISMFASKSRDAASASDELTDANSAVGDSVDEETAALQNAHAQLAMNIATLKEFNGSKEDEKKVVDKMNNTYGETMGYFSSVADWYKALIANSEAYCRQMVAEAKARKLANQVAELDLEADTLTDNINSGQYSKTRKKGKKVTVSGGGGLLSRLTGGTKTETYDIVGSSEEDKKRAELQSNRKKRDALNKKLNQTLGESSVDMPVKGSTVRPSGGGATPVRAPRGGHGGGGGNNTTGDKVENPIAEGSIDWYEKKLSELRKQINATGDDSVAAALQQEYEAVAAQLQEKKIKIGLEEPEQEEVLTYMESLQKDLEAAQNEFDNATTVEARVEASTAIDKIQQEINEATAGKLTIPAQTEPSYITQGSLEDKRASYSNAQNIASGIQQDYDIGLIGADEALAKMAELNKTLEAMGAKPIEIPVMSQDVDKAQERFQGAADAVGQMGSSLSGLGDALDLPELNIAGTIAQSIANVALGFSKAETEAADMGPWAWIAFSAMGLAQMVAVISSIKSATAFANGGIVSGPTYALVGEYAGASNNPEVIAPLDKLRSMIQPAGGGYGNVQFRLQGRNLVGVMANETRISSKSGKRSNIKI